MTPYTWRNFVTGASTAREGQMERFYFAKMAFYIQIVREKVKKWTKNGQKPSKKRCFSSTYDQLAQEFLKNCATFEEFRRGAGVLPKTPFFGGFLPVFYFFEGLPPEPAEIQY